MKHAILVTGDSGMLGPRTAKLLCERGHMVLGLSRTPTEVGHPNYRHIHCDLRRPDDVESVFATYRFQRVVHLAALAQPTGGSELSWSRYFRDNVLASHHIFECAARKNLPVFFASSVDVYGTQRGIITEATEVAPVGSYARSKTEAERRLRELMGSTPHMIARFAPMYANEDRSAIRKRCYLKYPLLAFTVGGGRDYALLNAERAAQVIARWAEFEHAPCGVINVTDGMPFNSLETIERDKRAGLTKRVVRVPMWAGEAMLHVSKLFPDMLRLNLHKIIAPKQFDINAMNVFMGELPPAPMPEALPAPEETE